MSFNFTYLYLFCFYIRFQVSSGEKFNVLFIIVDDLKPAIKCFGDKNAYTPNIDKLASRSFLFSKTYAQQALCAPSRNSMLTSRRPDSLHLYDFYSYWRIFVGNFTTLPQHFKENGYFTYSIGKVFHPGASSNFSDDYPYSWSKKPFHPKTQKYQNAKTCLNRDGTLASNLVCPVRVESQPGNTLPDLEILNEAKGFLENRDVIVGNKPYFLSIGFHKPHIPFKFPLNYLDYYPLANISLPKNRWKSSLLPEVAWNPWSDVRKREDIKKLNLSVPYGPMPDDVTKKITQSYYASITFIDDLIGKMIRAVNFSNTILVLTGDHGWSLGQHGEFAKYSNYEEATRVPLLIHVPNMLGQKTILDELVELVDLFPTLVDLTQVSTPLEMCPENQKNVQLCTEGRSLASLMYSAIRKKKESFKTAIFTQYPRPGPQATIYPNSDKPRLQDIQIMGYSIKTHRYRYCEWVAFDNKKFLADWNTTYGKEFYDHLIDPDENLNLSDKPQLKGIINQLQKRLHLGWRAATHKTNI